VFEKIHLAEDDLVDRRRIAEFGGDDSQPTTYGDQLNPQQTITKVYG